MSRTRYLPDSTSPWMPVIVLVVMLIGGGSVLVSQISGGRGPGVPFMALWLAIGLWNGYFWLIRVAYKIELDDGELFWFAPFRHGRLPIAELRSIERSALSRQLVRLTPTDGASVIIRNHREFSSLVADILAVHPDVEVGEIPISPWARAAGSTTAYKKLVD